MDRPLVTIGIPTYNRCGTLSQALRSALAQDHAPLEVVVSDNASSDDTERLCRDTARTAANVRYVRLPRNQGPVANFVSALQQARGEYFMWLADDDWLDPDYVSKCLAHLEATPGCALAAGRAHYYRGGQPLFAAPAVNVSAATGPERVRSFFSQVQDNFSMHGLGRHADWSRLRWWNVLGIDWFVVAGMAFQGEIATLETTRIHRDFTWSPTRIDEMARADWLPAGQSARPYLNIARFAAWDIAAHNPVYRTLSWPARLLLAQQVAMLVSRRHQALTGEIARLLQKYLPKSGLNALRMMRRALRPSR